MSFRLPATLLIIGLAALGGCRTSPHVASFIENRNAESRQLEDEYWRQVQENERLAYELARLKREREKSSGDIGPPKIEEGIGPPMIEIPDPSPPSTSDQAAPQIEAEPPPEMPVELPPPRGVSPAQHTEPETADQRVAGLFINPLHTGGVDLDRRPGDDGLVLCLEPRNAAGKFVPVAGNISVVLLDPQQSGDAARVARWNFSSREIQEAIRTDRDARGIYLEMPWPSRSPTNNQLRMFVRYESPEGRKIQSEREIFIRLAGQFSERWTPRPPERQRRNPLLNAPESEQADPAAAPAPPSRLANASESTPSAASVEQPTLKPAPPPSLSDAPAEARPRPTWKPYR